MNVINKFFCWAGGGHIHVLEEMRTEQNRFFGYGTVICMTATFAFLSSAYAFDLLLREQIGWLVYVIAFIWALFIFFLDRFFIVTIPNRGSTGMKFLKASPRLVLAVFIGIIISKPIEFRIFKIEIEEELQKMKTGKTISIDSIYRMQTARIFADKDSAIKKLLSQQQEYPPLEKRIEDIRKELVLKDTAIRQQYAQVNCECNGACGTGLVGHGKACKKEEERLAGLIKDKQQLEVELEEVQQKISAIRKNLQRKIDTVISPIYDAQSMALQKKKQNDQEGQGRFYTPSILNQQIALGNIQNDKNKPNASLTVWFITILFIIIEMGPMLLKLMTKASAYDNRIAQIEATYSTDDRLNRLLDLEEFKSNQRLVYRLAGAQRDIITKAMENWHREQMNKMREEPDYFNDFFRENSENNNHH